MQWIDILLWILTGLGGLAVVALVIVLLNLRVQ